MSGLEEKSLLTDAREDAFILFSDLSELVHKCREFASKCTDEVSSRITESTFNRLDQYLEQVCNIRDILSRQHLKVVFFGRTSSGKSTLINALLGEKVLPSGIGHTTNCFIQIQGTSRNEASLLVPIGEQGCFTETNVSNLTDIANALSDQHIDEKSLVVLNWPRSRCRLLEDDVILVDSPGIDVTKTFDDWIEDNCADADIFVLVANSESTIMMREKNFFKEVSEKISKPNIVIVENRWDCTDFEEKNVVDLVKSQHVQRCGQFLIDDLKTTSQGDLMNRLFFTSGKEILTARMREKSGNIRREQDRFRQDRVDDFDRFERLMKDSLTYASIHTKYGSHCKTGKMICIELVKIFENLAESGFGLKKQCLIERQELMSSIDRTENEMKNISDTLRDQIHEMLEQTIQRVSVVFHEEINNLNELINDFNIQFYDDEVVKLVYVQEMERFLVHGLMMNMKRRIGKQISSYVVQSQEDMVLQISEQLPECKRSTFLETIPANNPFEISFFMETSSSMDFNFNSSFQFSYGVFFWARESISTFRKMFKGANGSSDGNNILAQNGSTMSTVSKLTLLALASQNSMAGMLASSILCRRIGLRLVGLTLVTHGALYFYEKINWGSGGQESAIKEKFVLHLQGKLRMLVYSVTTTCCQQIQQELQFTLAVVCKMVEESVDKMKRECEATEQKLGCLTENLDILEDLIYSSEDIGIRMEDFENHYLCPR